MTEYPNEEILPDAYPVYGDFFYVVDGKPYRSDWHDITVGRLKQHLNAKEVRRFNILARQVALGMKE